MSRTKKLSDSEVLRLAFNVIAREGFSSFTFSQVGKEVGLSPAALVKRFKTKKNMALLARNRRWEENLGHVQSEKFNQLFGLKGIFDFLEIIGDSVNSKRLGEHAVWLGTEACQLRSRKKVAAYFEETRSIFCKLLTQAISSNELSIIIEPRQFSKTLEALVQGAIFQFAFLDEKSIKYHLKQHFRLIMKPYSHVDLSNF